jgi:hypothetical protein
MKKLSIFIAFALAACGSQPMVRSDDLYKHLESKGYSKVAIREAFSCGSMGKGRGFIATKKDNSVVVGQICFKKTGGNVLYTVDEKKTIKKA